MIFQVPSHRCGLSAGGREGTLLLTNLPAPASVLASAGPRHAKIFPPSVGFPLEGGGIPLAFLLLMFAHGNSLFGALIIWQTWDHWAAAAVASYACVGKRYACFGVEGVLSENES